MEIALIWAMADNRVIGRDNDLPWDLPLDMRHFIRTTKGKPVVMGRKTFESMIGPLPGRENIVMTRDASWQKDGAVVVADLDAALEHAEAHARAKGLEQVMVIGGADIYAMALPRAHRLYVTHVHAEIEGHVRFPEFDMSEWRQVSAERFEIDEQHAYPFTIAEYERA